MHPEFQACGVYGAEHEYTPSMSTNDPIHAVSQTFEQIDDGPIVSEYQTRGYSLFRNASAFLKTFRSIHLTASKLMQAVLSYGIPFTDHTTHLALRAWAIPSFDQLLHYRD